MFKISKMTDYGVVVMAQLAQATDAVVTAPDIASAAGLPMPTVAKILKRMGRGGLVTSTRGIRGGYALSRPAEQPATNATVTTPASRRFLTAVP